MPSRRALVFSLALLAAGGVERHTSTAAPAETQTVAPPTTTAAGPATSTAPVATVRPEITAAIRQLDDDSYARREAATEYLWTIGRDAEPALEAVAAHGVPEARARAQRILEKFRYGIYPDTPPEIADLVNRYQSSDANGRLSIIGILGDKGGYGILVLGRLVVDETDATLQENIRTVVKARAARAAETAAILLASRERAAATRMLDEAALSGDAAVYRASAALALSSGQLPARLAALGPALHTGSDDARRAAYLYRAAGDLDNALRWAELSKDSRLIEDLLLEKHDWTRLVNALQRNTETPEDLRRTGLIAAVQHFAGDDSGFNASVARLRNLGKRADTQSQAVMAFLLNGQVDDALSIYLDRKAYLSAFDIYRYTGRFSEAIALADRAATESHPDAQKLRVVAARLLWRLGERDKADALLNTAIAQVEKVKDFTLAVLLCEAENELGRPDRARDFATLALAGSKEGDSFPWLFGKLFPGRDADATLWWRLLRELLPETPDGDVLARMTALLENRVPADELQATADSAVKMFAAMPDKPLCERWLQLLADSLRAAGRPEPADTLIQYQTESRKTRGEWAKVGERFLEQKDWPAAADAYKRASARPADAPDSVWLRGYVLVESGSVDEGRAAMAYARELPLADERRRHDLAEAMLARGRLDEARDERQLIMRVGPSRGWYFYESAKQLGNDAARRGDFLKASEYWQLFLLQVLDDGGAFVDETAYLDLPQLVHRNRARGLIAHGDIPAALTELRAYAAVAPAVAQLAIDFVPELEKTGHRAEADELFSLVMARVKKVYGEFPRSSYFHNDIAWACTLCGRLPEEALAHARLAVELTPSDTNSLDTLAEIHFRSGRLAEAEAVMKKCIELEPNQDRHRKRLEGFKAGKGFGG